MLVVPGGRQGRQGGGRCGFCKQTRVRRRSLSTAYYCSVCVPYIHPSHTAHASISRRVVVRYIYSSASSCSGRRVLASGGGRNEPVCRGGRGRGRSNCSFQMLPPLKEAGAVLKNFSHFSLFKIFEPCHKNAHSNPTCQNPQKMNRSSGARYCPSRTTCPITFFL